MAAGNRSKEFYEDQAKTIFVENWLKGGRGGNHACTDLVKSLKSGCVKTGNIKVDDEGGPYSHFVVDVDGVMIDCTILHFCFPLTTEEQNDILTKYGMNQAAVTVGWGRPDGGLAHDFKKKLEECAPSYRETILDKPYYVGKEEDHPLYDILQPFLRTPDRL